MTQKTTPSESNSENSTKKVKKVDARIKTLIDNCVKLNQRSFFILVGKSSKKQIVTLHYLLSKARDSDKPSILWCYNKELGFQGDNVARLKQFKTMAKKRQENVVKQNEIRKKKQMTDVLQKEMEKLLSDPFHLFLSCNKIQYAYYKDTQRVLGNTYGMLVLQDFEGITPNILARTIETVEGSGSIVLLLPDLDSLKDLYSTVMDIHASYIGSSDDTSRDKPRGRFVERFLLSLATCNNALVMDDELNILPLSSHITSIVPIQSSDDTKMGKKGAFVSEREQDLQKLINQLNGTQPLGSIASLTRTMDQCESLIQFVEAISEKTLQSTIALTASRGRGKSATLGLSIAAAVAYGYSNIFVTAPSPENLHTLFEFVCKGFSVLGMKESSEYELVLSTNPETKGAVIRINIFKDHRQTIQYIHPEDASKLSQAELVVIDEAAAIPLPIVKSLFGSYLVFISSTVNGYEGTGRSLSLKLIEELKTKYVKGTDGKINFGRKFHELTLDEPIRYSRNDPVESWLYKLLCLDATTAPNVESAPHPDDCTLYYVNRDTLFSFHAASEKFLHNMMSLFVSSHYKNSPNDLQLLSDAPDQHIFVLLGPIDSNTSSLPDIFCVIQVGLEGKIRREIIEQAFKHGKAPSGDLIPFVISRQFQEVEFSTLSGARVVRIATHPQWQSMGYGAKALKELEKYFKGEIIRIDDDDMEDSLDEDLEDEDDGEDQMNEDIDEGSIDSEEKELMNQLRTELLKPKDRNHLPPLLLELSERPPESLDYIGVSFGLTEQLYRFWMRSNYEPLYLRLAKNSHTGEHSCIMIRELKQNTWLNQFTNDFRRRFLTLLGYDFKSFPVGLSLNILGIEATEKSHTGKLLSVQEFDSVFSPFDFKRLVAYSKDMIDYHVIMDLTPQLSRWYFERKTDFTLNMLQASLLVGLGLQHRSISELCEEFDKPSNQLLSFFNKTIRKFVKFLTSISKNRYIEEKKITIEESHSNPKNEISKINGINKNSDDKVSNDSKNNKFDSIFGPNTSQSIQSIDREKKRKKDDQDSEHPLKKQKTEELDSSIVDDILKNDEFKVNHIDIDALTKEEKGEKKIQKHMLKTKTELKRMKKLEHKKLYKKGGKKRKIAT